MQYIKIKEIVTSVPMLELLRNRYD